MDETKLRAALERYWETMATDPEIAHEIYHDDAVLEFPQSQERFVGKENFKAWREDLSGCFGVQGQAHKGPGRVMGHGELAPI